MILLSRLRLINWHNFADDLLDIQQITYLIGVNGVGKTTILDALRYCLTTNKNFNALGNRKSKRTLLGSVHGKQRDQDEGRPRYSRKATPCPISGLSFRTRPPSRDRRALSSWCGWSRKIQTRTCATCSSAGISRPGRHPGGAALPGPGPRPHQTGAVLFKTGARCRTQTNRRQPETGSAGPWASVQLSLPWARNSAPYSPWAPVSTTLRISGNLSISISSPSRSWTYSCCSRSRSSWTI